MRGQKALKLRIPKTERALGRAKDSAQGLGSNLYLSECHMNSTGLDPGDDHFMYGEPKDLQETLTQTAFNLLKLLEVYSCFYNCFLKA